MKSAIIIFSLINLFSFGSKLFDIYTYEDNGITHVTSDPSVSIYLVETKDFKGNRSPAIVSNR